MFKDIVTFIRQLYQTNDFIPLHEPRFRGNERKYLEECIDSTFVSSVGKFVDLFEQKLAEYTGAKYAVATMNGTAALHIALKLAGVREGDLVLTQPLTFVATCNAISYCGAQPLFIDVDRSTLGLSPEKLEDFLTTATESREEGLFLKTTGQRIAACVPMHTFGHPVRIDELQELCKQNHIPLVEDAAESIGSAFKNQHTGTFGLLGTFSLNGNKTITSGGGGAIITDNENLAKLAKHLTTQAKVPHTWEYGHDMVGYNYRLPNINSALACAQLEQLDDFIDDKRFIAKAYSAFFQNSGITFFTEPGNARSNYWLNSVFLKDRKERDEFLTFTNENGIMTRPVWKLMNQLKMNKDAPAGNLENAVWIEDRLVNIPSSIRVNK